MVATFIQFQRPNLGDQPDKAGKLRALLQNLGMGELDQSFAEGIDLIGLSLKDFHCLDKETKENYLNFFQSRINEQVKRYVANKLAIDYDASEQGYKEKINADFSDDETNKNLYQRIIAAIFSDKAILLSDLFLLTKDQDNDVVNTHYPKPAQLIQAADGSIRQKLIKKLNIRDFPDGTLATVSTKAFYWHLWQKIKTNLNYQRLEKDDKEKIALIVKISCGEANETEKETLHYEDLQLLEKLQIPELSETLLENVTEHSRKHVLKETPRCYRIITEAPKFRNIAFQGGGPKGGLHGGAIEYMEDHGLLKDIQTVTGSSAGAFIALTVALGMDYKMRNTAFNDIVSSLSSTSKWNIRRNPDEFGEILNNLIIEHLKTLLQDINTIPLSKFKLPNKDFNRKTAEWYQDYFRNMIKNKEAKLSLTFKDLAVLKNIFPDKIKDLLITATANKEKKQVVFDFKNTPDIPIYKAAQASATLPILFLPTRMNLDGKEVSLIDGGVWDNLPFALLQQRAFRDDVPINHNMDFDQNPQTLCLAIGNERDQKRALHDRHKTFSRANRLKYKIGNFVTNLNYEELNKVYFRYLDEYYSHHTIFLDPEEIGLTSFQITDEQKERLRNNGEKATKNYFNLHQDELIAYEYDTLFEMIMGLDNNNLNRLIAAQGWPNPVSENTEFAQNSDSFLDENEFTEYKTAMLTRNKISENIQNIKEALKKIEEAKIKEEKLRKTLKKQHQAHEASFSEATQQRIQELNNNPRRPGASEELLKILIEQQNIPRKILETNKKIFNNANAANVEIINEQEIIIRDTLPDILNIIIDTEENIVPEKKLKFKQGVFDRIDFECDHKFSGLLLKKYQNRDSFDDIDENEKPLLEFSVFKRQREIKMKTESLITRIKSKNENKILKKDNKRLIEGLKTFATQKEILENLRTIKDEYQHRRWKWLHRFLNAVHIKIKPNACLQAEKILEEYKHIPKLVR